jgi:hypothetical protein
MKVGDVVEATDKNGTVHRGLLVEKKEKVTLPTGRGRVLWSVLRADTNRIDIWLPEGLTVISASR